METLSAIKARRSIRHFKPDTVDRRIIERLLDMAICSPSAKNDQPWRFVILTGNSKRELLRRLYVVLDELESSGCATGSLRGSLQAMREAPVVILVFNGAER